jgi:hypothetical protein
VRAWTGGHYPCWVHVAELDELVAHLSAASTVAGSLAPDREVLGVRAVETGPARRYYLVALSGPRFVCLDDAKRPIASSRVAREVAAAALLCEQALDEIDTQALHALAQAAGSALATSSGSPTVDAALGVVAQRALALAAWRAAPIRAISSVADLEQATALHRALQEAHAAYLTATEPLVENQVDLSGALVARLAEIDECAGRAGTSTAFSDRLGAWIGPCDEGATDVLAAHLTELD